MPTSHSARELALSIGPFTRHATGNISGEDAGFLLTLIQRELPRHILEIGVASGTSTLMMLCLLEQQGASTRLDSVDIAETYYGDTSKRVGYLVQEFFATPPSRWRLIAGVGAADLHRHPAIVQSAPERRYDFVFIDANHAHPWPTLDALCLLPWVQPGTMVVFHDINLPLLGDFPLHGAVHVVRDWPGSVEISEDPRIPNTGAFRLEDAGPGDARHLVESLARPWDAPLDRKSAELLLGHLAAHLPEDIMVRVRQIFATNGSHSGR